MMTSNKKPIALFVLIVAQVLCAAVFVWDVYGDQQELGWAAFSDTQFIIEAVAAIALAAAVVIETRFLMDLLQRKAHLERQVSIAANAFHEVVEARFAAWGLTPSERDVAHFTVKGCSITEIASLRGSAEGTVKSHLNAIYRKAGVASRGEFLALLIEDLTVMSAADAPAQSMAAQ